MEQKAIAGDSGPAVRWDWRRPLGFVLVAAPALWLLFTIAHLVMSGRVWWWRPADLLPPLAFLIVPVLLGLAAIPCRRTRRLAGALSVAGLAVGVSLAGLNLAGPFHRTGPVPHGAIRVVSWNTEYWHEPGKEDAFYQLLRAQQADVYLLQEYMRYPDAVPERIDVAERLHAELPGYHLATTGELLTLSRFPIVRELPVSAPGTYVPPDSDFPDYWLYKALRTDLQIGDRVLSVYNVHVPTPVWIGGPGVFSAEFWSTIRTQHAARGPHMQALADDVAGNRNPVLLAGDMNTTPAMREHWQFPENLNDAAGASGSLFPVSWPAGDGPLPLWWRLDWTLVSPDTQVHTYEFRDPGGQSDHRLQYVVVSP